jgi:hypothetical protein
MNIKTEIVMKARKHRGGFAESIATMKEIPNTLDAVSEYFGLPKKSIVIEEGRDFDNRKGWESKSWFVSSKNGGVYGMISEELK